MIELIINTISFILTFLDELYKYYYYLLLYYQKYLRVKSYMYIILFLLDKKLVL